jgi:hypothetical protein
VCTSTGSFYNSTFHIYTAAPNVSLGTSAREYCKTEHKKRQQKRQSIAALGGVVRDNHGSREEIMVTGSTSTIHLKGDQLL